MAYWQFAFWAIPQNALLKKYTEIPEKISEDDFNLTEWFIDYLPESFLNSINYLPVNQHWNKNTIYFGDYDNNSIEISYDDKNKKIIEMYFRIDLRENYEDILKNMLNSLSIGKLVIFDEDLNNIKQTYTKLLSQVHLFIDERKYKMTKLIDKK